MAAPISQQQSNAWDNRPTLTTAWSLFTKIYGDGTLPHVADAIGGKVAKNINSGIFTNCCTIRMSYVLNYGGWPINRSEKTVSGDDKLNYLFRVHDLISHLKTIFGVPENSKRGTAQGKTLPAASEFADPGIVVFDVPGWSDATGHATLWNGSRAADHDYFGRATGVLLWRLP